MMEPISIVGILTAGAVIHSVIKTASATNDIEACVNAYYADKYNGINQGSPSKTFLKCMATQYPETFRDAQQRYAARENRSPSNS
jgi:hypothetical protein